MKSKEGFAGRDFNLLRPAPVDGTLFSWRGDIGCAEISDLGKGFSFERVWNDACDEGLTLISPSGREVVFSVVEVDTCPEEGDVLAWHLTGATRGYEHIALTIFND